MAAPTAGFDLIRPDWPAPLQVQACTTTRIGGVSRGSWQGLNLGDHVGDEPSAVARNRARVAERLALPCEPRWLTQVHGTRVRGPADDDACADACFEDRPGQVCVVLTADCLPV
ncbi:MAG: laccase domain-containing protein, partial [Sedimenticolaceae bacterium]